MNAPIYDQSDALLARAREWLASFRRSQARAGSNGPSEATRKVYTRIARRLDRKASIQGVPPADLLHRYTTLVRFREHFAAFRWHAAQTLGNWIDAVERDTTRCSSQQSREAVANLLDQLESLKRPLDARIKPVRKETRSEARLPRGWREAMIAQAPIDSRVGLLVLALSGCRPVELARGVVCRLCAKPEPYQNEKRLSLAIKGAKTRNGRGQPVRTLFIDLGPGAHFAVQLRAALEARPDLLPADSWVVAIGYRSLARTMDELSRSLWCDPATRAKPYDFRYAFRRDCDCAGMSRGEIALLMGHQSEQSSIAYGLPRRAPGTMTAMSVKGTTASRERASPELGSDADRSAPGLELEREFARRRQLERQRELEFDELPR